MERERRDWIPRASMESISVLLVYESITYSEMNPYLNGVHLTLDSFKPYIYEKVWSIRG